MEGLLSVSAVEVGRSFFALPGEAKGENDLQMELAVGVYTPIDPVYAMDSFDPEEAGIDMGTASDTEIADTIIKYGDYMSEDDIPHIRNKIIYVVRSDADPTVDEEFDDEDQAIEYAKRSDTATVYECEVEVDEGGDIINELSEEILWSYDDEW